MEDYSLCLDSRKIQEGWLDKMGQINASWKSRYFVLYDDRTLSYYSSPAAAQSRNKAKGTIYLSQVSTVNQHSFGRRRSSTQITQKRRSSTTSRWLSGWFGTNPSTEKKHEEKEYDFREDMDDDEREDENFDDSAFLNDETFVVPPDGKYSFELVQASRTWSLASSSKLDVATWVENISKLIRGATTHYGWLCKRGAKVTSWKRRYVTLHDTGILNYYTSGDPSSFVGTVDLRQAIWVRNCDDEEFGRPCTFEVGTLGRNWVFQTEASHLRPDWVKRITKVVGETLKFDVECMGNVDVHITHNHAQLNARYMILCSNQLILFKSREQSKKILQINFFSWKMFSHFLNSRQCFRIPLYDAQISGSESCVMHERCFQVTLGMQNWHFCPPSDRARHTWLQKLLPTQYSSPFCEEAGIAASRAKSRNTPELDGISFRPPSPLPPRQTSQSSLLPSAFTLPPSAIIHEDSHDFLPVPNLIDHTDSSDHTDSTHSDGLSSKRFARTIPPPQTMTNSQQSSPMIQSVFATANFHSSEVTKEREDQEVYVPTGKLNLPPPEYRRSAAHSAITSGAYLYEDEFDEDESDEEIDDETMMRMWDDAQDQRIADVRSTLFEESMRYKGDDIVHRSSGSVDNGRNYSVALRDSGSSRMKKMRSQSEQYGAMAYPQFIGEFGVL